MDKEMNWREDDFGVFSDWHLADSRPETASGAAAFYDVKGQNWE